MANTGNNIPTELEINNIRSNLIRQEETIIFACIERAQFRQNMRIYQINGLYIPDFKGSFLQYLLQEQEQVFAKVRRYQAPDEHPFSQDLPPSILGLFEYPWPIDRNSININQLILSQYPQQVINRFCQDGDDNNYGSSAVCDVLLLQSLSKRIHYGKFVAESKYRQQTSLFQPLIRQKDISGLFSLITKPDIESQLLHRIRIKATTYGQDPLQKDSLSAKIQAEALVSLYQDWIIPLTKEVEVSYLLAKSA